MKKILLTSTLFAIVFSSTAFAQIEIGASYELRNEEPKSGFGLRIQKGFLDALPMVDLGLRAHFSYFTEDSDNPASAIEGFTNYDIGLAAYGGISLGLLQPYVGAGLGSETIKIDRPAFAPDQNEESNIYWNTFAGAKVTIIPLVKPFMEYRYSNKKLGSPTLADEQNGRFIIGVSLSF